MSENVLTCPIRGKLKIGALAKDGLTISEEARRIDFIKFLIKRKYPKTNIEVETIVIKDIGESGRNKVRCDVIVYKEPVDRVSALPLNEKLKKAILIAEIKRDAKKQKSGILNQLHPALIQMPNTSALGAYWDDTTKLLYAKNIVKKDDNEFIEIIEDSLENLPPFGKKYQSKTLKINDLSEPDDLMGLLYNVAHIMRSHGVNDDQLRYKESVKLILARYCDEIEAESKKDNELSMQVFPGGDSGFHKRIKKYYTLASKRYSRAKSLFNPSAESELEERTLRAIIKLIQGVYFRKATSEMMQQVFQSFVPSVFKKNLDQYFTPHTLIETMVEMVDIGPLDKIADPAMGTGDFLTGAMDYRTNKRDSDIIQRIFGSDVDPKAYDLAVINMILNKDGQSNLIREDSIEHEGRWKEEMDIALCNPPFGENSVETRDSILEKYDLGHEWSWSTEEKKWIKTDNLLSKQQLGILFIEKCYKILDDYGRMAIILPEGYLCTYSYGYIRQWILSNFRIISLIELPRRIFLKSDADLRSNILVAQKLPEKELKKLVKYNYPIHTEIVRKVGYKLGSGFAIIPSKDPETGVEIRDENNELIIDTDFKGVVQRFKKFSDKFKVYEPTAKQIKVKNDWTGGSISDIISRVDLDIKPRRLAIKALNNIREIKSKTHFKVKDIADVITDLINLSDDKYSRLEWKLVVGQSIRAVEGTVIPEYPQKAWEIIDDKGYTFYKLNNLDIVIGLVRPERRNVGIHVDSSDNVIASPDGVSIVRLKSSNPVDYLTQEWLYYAMRLESSRIQFWTESGGTSYGKLSKENIEQLLIEIPSKETVIEITNKVKSWIDTTSKSISTWENIWSDKDKFPIINSPIFGLEPTDF